MTATAAPTSVGRRCRPATPADAAACARVNLTTWRETYGHQLPDAFWSSQTLAARTLAWTERLDGGVPVTIAEVDDEVVGFAIAGPARDRGAHRPVRDLELRSLYVLAAHHGAGIGSDLLEAVLPRRASAQLWVSHDNARARRSYSRHGFVPDGATHHDARFGDLLEVRLVR